MRTKDSRAPFVLLASRTFGSCCSTARPTLVHSNKAMPTSKYMRSTNSGAGELCPLQLHPEADSFDIPELLFDAHPPVIVADYFRDSVRQVGR